MWIRSGVSVFLSVLLTSCGGGSGGSGDDTPTAPPINPPPSSNASLSLSFPANGSLVLTDRISFSGSADGIPSDANVEIRVQSGSNLTTSPITTSDWLVDDVPVEASQNVNYRVDLYVDGVSSDSTTVAMSYDGNLIPFGLGDAMAISQEDEIIYLADGVQLIQIDASSGERTVVLDFSFFVSRDVVDVVWLPDTETIVLLDEGGDINIYQLTNGSFEWLPASGSFSGDAVSSGPGGNDLYVYQSIDNELQQYDSALGRVGEVSLQNYSQEFDDFTPMGSDLLMAGEDLMVVVDPFTSISESASLASLGLGNIGDLEIDTNRDEIYLRSVSNNELWRVSIQNRNPLTLTTEQVDLDGSTAYSVAYSIGQDKLVFSSPNKLSAFSPDTANVDVVSSISWGDGAEWLSPASVALNEDGTTAYVSDLATDDIYRVDLATGDRTPMGISGTNVEAITDMVQDGADIYSVDWVRKTVLRTDVNTGVTQDIVTHTSGQPSLAEPVALDIDSSLFRVFVLDRGLRAICEVDTNTGNAVILADSSDASALTLARDLSFNEAEQAIYWTSWLDNSLNRLNLNNLQTDKISGGGIGGGLLFGRPGPIALTSDGLTAYVADVLDGSVFAVDLVSGDRMLVVEPGELDEPASIAYNDATGLLVVLDTSLGALYALDTISGDAVLISM